MADGQSDSVELDEKGMDTLGIEPNTSRMLSERDNQLHHAPDESSANSAGLPVAGAQIQKIEVWLRLHFLLARRNIGSVKFSPSICDMARAHHDHDENVLRGFFFFGGCDCLSSASDPAIGPL